MKDYPGIVLRFQRKHSAATKETELPPTSEKRRPFRSSAGLQFAGCFTLVLFLAMWAWVLIPTGVGAQQNRPNLHDAASPGVKDVSMLQAFVMGSSSVKGLGPDVYFGGKYRDSFGLVIGLKELKRDQSYCLLPLVYQTLTKNNQMIKGFQGAPFSLQVLETNNDIELLSPVTISIINDSFKCRETPQIAFPKGAAIIRNEPGIPKYGGKFFFAAGTVAHDWGFEQVSRGTNIEIADRSTKAGKEIYVNIGQEGNCIVPSGDSVVPFLCNSLGFPERAVPNAVGVVWVLRKPGTKIRIGAQEYESHIADARIEFARGGPKLIGVRKSE